MLPHVQELRSHVVSPRRMSRKLVPPDSFPSDQLANQFHAAHNPIFTQRNRAVSSVVEHYLDTVGVRGSKPLPRTITSPRYTRHLRDLTERLKSRLYQFYCSKFAASADHAITPSGNSVSICSEMITMPDVLPSPDHRRLTQASGVNSRSESRRLQLLHEERGRRDYSHPN